VSHFTVVRTEIRHISLLLSALRAMGYDHVEVHEEPQHLYGFQGDLRPETAEVIIRRQHIGHAANDVGFKRQPSGEFLAIISEYDRKAHCPESWMEKLKTRYARRQVLESLEKQGIPMENVVEREEADGSYTFEVPLDEDQMQSMIAG
jgi:hypothetical protein